jgi:hypothetical protein
VLWIFNTLLKGMVADLVNGMLDPIKSLKCDFYNNGCPTPNQFMCNNTDPKVGYCCEKNASSQCKVDSSNKQILYPNPLGVVGKVDVGTLIGSLLPGLSGVVELGVIAGQKEPVDVNKIVEAGGLTLATWGGIKSIHSDCVPLTPMPEKPVDSKVPDLEFLNAAPICQQCDPIGPICPTGATCDAELHACVISKNPLVCPTVPFMMAIGVHEYFISKLLWAAFDSGLLCSGIGTSAIPMLSSGILGALIPEVKIMTNPASIELPGDASAILQLRPISAPVIRIGEGVVKFTAKGVPYLDKPLLTIQIDRMAADFYVTTYDRNTRIFTLNLSLSIPLALEVLPSKTNPLVMSIQPVIADFTAELAKGLTVSNTELVATSADAIANAFKGVVAALLGPLIAQGLPSFDLPAIQGFIPDIMSIRGEFPYADADKPPYCKDQTGENACRQFLLIYAGLELAPPTTTFVAATQAEVKTISVPTEPQMKLVGTEDEVIPSVTVAVSGNSPDLEYSYRVDDGLWAMLRRGTELEVKSHLFLLQGHHTIDVISRVAGKPYTTDTKGVRLTVPFDIQPPEIVTRAEPNGDLRVKAWDLVSAPEAVEVSYRVDGGQWHTIANGGVIPAAELVAGVLELSAVDESGLTASLTRSVAVPPDDDQGATGAHAAHGAAGSAAASGCGCTSVQL